MVSIMFHSAGLNRYPWRSSYVSDSLGSMRLKLEALSKAGFETVCMEAACADRDRRSRRVLLTFDDGYQNIYDNAYPVMERYGFTGTVYIVANRMKSEGFLNAEQLQELLDQGWEVGSHGMTHTELTQNHSLVRNEILQSRLDLNEALGIKVFSFAYPFGSLDWYISNKVLDYGYFAAVGVGNLSQHSFGTVYNLSRREIEGGATLEEFEELLPWTGRYVPPRRKYTPL